MKYNTVVISFSGAIAFALLALFSCSGEPAGTEPAIIPRPNQLLLRSGSGFTLKPETRIMAPPKAMPVAEYLRDLLRDKTGTELAIVPFEKGVPEDGTILLNLLNKGDSLSEAYTLMSGEEYIWITSDGKAGLFYGIQTLRQILGEKFERGALSLPLEVQSLQIEDHPRFEHRGMLLDCCRHFMEKDFIKRYIDLLALYKMNVFHWHLTEDQGWRIAIDAYPKLTETGAWRTEADGTRYGGFYSKDDVREIVAYAASRHITVIPEIEMPGHSSAAIASYPRLSCTGENIEVENEWGVFKDIYCAGNDSVFSFLETVLSEVVELFPGKYIHIGGDEAPKIRWEECSLCQKRIADEQLANEHQLQSWFIERIGRFLESKGKVIIGWDEILEGGLPEGAIVQSWRGMEGGVQAALKGHEAIMSPTSHAYFDYGPELTDLEEVYSFNPVPAALGARGAALIRGGECNMWTEHAPQDKVDNRVFPRILAMSEVLWSPDTTRNYPEFLGRVRNHYPLLEALGVDYGPETVPVKISTKVADPITGQLEIELSPGSPGMEIRYTMVHENALYDAPIRTNESGKLLAWAMLNGKISGDTLKRDIVVHRGIGAELMPDFVYSPNYTGGGDRALADGIRGTLNFRDGHWQGVQGGDIALTLDLGTPRPLRQVSAGFLQYGNAWIFTPDTLRVEVSRDGENWKPAGDAAFLRAREEKEIFIEDFAVAIPEGEWRYVKLRAANLGTLPEWHDAAGSDAWLFCDEIMIESR